MSDIQEDWRSSDYLLGLTGDSRDLLLKQAEVLLEKKDYEQAWSRLNREAFKFVSDPHQSFLKGKTAFYLGEYADAERYLVDARELGYTEDELFYLLAAASLKSGDSEGAIGYVNILLALQQKPEFHSLKAQVLLESGDTVLAEKEFQLSMGQDSTIRENYLGLGRVYLHKGNSDRSLAFIDRWLQSEPRDREFLMIKAAIYDQQGQYQAAGEIYSMLNDPANPEMMALRAKNYYQQKKYDSAAIFSNLALELTDQTGTRLLLARSLEGQRLYMEAENQYRLILSRDSTVSEAQEAVTRLEQRSAYLRYLREQEQRALDMAPPQPNRIDLNDSIR